MHPEVGTGGRARRKVLETPAPDYFSIDLYSDEVLSEEILFQGRLNKFQAGFKTSFIPKWIIVTKSSFRYYRNMEVSISNPKKPLLVLPVAAIYTCQRVNFDLGLSKTEIQDQANFLVNQFEIFLRDDFLPLYLKSNYDGSIKNMASSNLYEQQTAGKKAMKASKKPVDVLRRESPVKYIN